MEFKLESNGIHIVCYSPVWTQKMITWGARLIEPRQAEELTRALEAKDLRDDPARGQH